jgi:hypothetical protein
MSAKKEDLGELHALVAKHFKKRLKEGDVTASELGVMVNFLRHNGIEAEITKTNPLGELVNVLPFKRKEIDEEDERSVM